ncbi:FKBP-type peptidyl-prolyl cis-trans isomerase [Novipirellula maiorica]|nr:FKBP-type peptidyl-prolyl cis-trans isomerase [Rhodopirellula maiorica]
MLKTALLLLLFVSMTLGANGDEVPADDKDSKLKPGPVDPQEKDKPGAIDEDAKAEFKKTDSGLKYRILRKSDKAKPTAKDSVEVHYKGWLDDGSIFDSSYRRGAKISFPLSGVIKGWTEGMQLIGEGGMIELEIPAELGYGQRGAGGVIPPNAKLHFIVELFEIK